MKKILSVFLMIFMACGYANAMPLLQIFMTPGSVSAIQFSKHDAKAFKNAYLEEEIGLFNQHLKELKASKQYKSVRLLYPGANTELYYEVTNSDGKKGLLYSTISSNNEVKDTLLVPMQYYGFAIMPRTTGEEPYIAYNAQRTFTRPMYFHHEHEETVIFASITPKVNQWDIYSASHLVDYKSAMTCYQMLANIQNRLLSYVMGLVILNAKVFCPNDDEYLLYVRSETNNACMYTAAGQPIFTESQNILVAAIYTERCASPQATGVQYVSKENKVGAGHLIQIDPWMPCIFADANFSPNGDLLVQVSEMSPYEKYDYHKDYEAFIHKSNSPIAAFYQNLDFENGIKKFCEMPKSQQTTEDAFYAALCCRMEVSEEMTTIKSINGLLEHTADLQTADLPNIEKMQYFTQLGKQLYEDVKTQDKSLTEHCNEGMFDLTHMEQVLPAILQEYEARDITRSAIYERQRQQAEFWGNLIGGFLSGVVDAAGDAIDRRISGTSSPTISTPVSTYSNSYSTSSSATTSTSTNERENNYNQSTTTGNSTRILELERKIHTYEGHLKNAQEFKRKCEAEHSNLLGWAIKDVNEYERIIRESKDELNRLKSGH